MIRLLLLVPLVSGTSYAQQVAAIAIPHPIGGSPVRELQPDGRIAVRSEYTQPITGEFAGTFTERSTQVFASDAANGVVASSALFKIETSTGSIEGYYSGRVDRSTGETAQKGAVVAASRNYSEWLNSAVSFRVFLTEEGLARGVLELEAAPVLGDWLLEDVGPATPERSLEALRDATPDSDGTTFYFTARGVDGVGVYRVGYGGGTVSTVAAGDPFRDPRGIVISPVSGLLYVADPRAGEEGQGRIFVIDPVSGSVEELPQTMGYAPQNLALLRKDANDVVYFTGRDWSDRAPAILRTSVDDPRPPQIVFKGDPLVDPDGIAVARGGDLYVNDRSGSVIRISGNQATRLATKLRAGNPAGIALTKDERLVLASVVEDGQARLLLIDPGSLNSGLASKGMLGNDGAGGLHRAEFNNVFSWAGYAGGQGTVYHVPVGSLPKP